MNSQYLIVGLFFLVLGPFLVHQALIKNFGEFRKKYGTAKGIFFWFFHDLFYGIKGPLGIIFSFLGVLFVGSGLKIW